MLIDHPKQISHKNIKRILWEIENCICKVLFKEDQSTGFFTQISIPKKNKIVPVLILSSHSHNYKLDGNETFSLIIESENNIKKINLKGRKYYTNEKYDTTIIELNENDNINHFLELDNDFKNFKYEKETIYILHYPNGELSVSFGIVSNIFEDIPYEFSHLCSTQRGSSGGPIIKYDNKLIGIHFKGHSNYNSATFLNYPINKFIFLNYLFENNNENINKTNEILSIKDKDKLNISMTEIKSNDKTSDKDLEKKYNAIIKENIKLKNNNNDYFQNLKFTKAQLKEYAEKIDELKKSNTVLDKKNMILNDNIKTIESDKNKLLIELKNDKIKIKNLNNELTTEKNKNHDFIKQFKEKDKEAAKMKSDLILRNQEISKLKTELQKKEDETAKTVHNLNQLNQLLEQKNLENLNLKNSLDNLIPITVGLDNIGANYIMNATLQSLSSIRELTQYFLEKYIPNKNNNISKEYYTVVKNLWDIKNNGKSFNPYSFKEAVKKQNPFFEKICENESIDLLNFLLEKLHEELNLVCEKKLDFNYLISYTPEDQLDEKKMWKCYYDDFNKRYYNIIQ